MHVWKDERPKGRSSAAGRRLLARADRPTYRLFAGVAGPSLLKVSDRPRAWDLSVLLVDGRSVAMDGPSAETSGDDASGKLWAPRRPQTAP